MNEPAMLISMPLQTERLDNGCRVTLRDLHLRVDQHDIIVPAGTVTDFTSIPRPICPFISWSRVDVAGVVHDHLYQSGHLPRHQADRIWRLVACSGPHCASRLQAWGGWILLRVGGWYAWRRHRRQRP